MSSEKGSHQTITQEAKALEVDADRIELFESLIYVAAGLFGDGQGGELGENPEYERGIAELTCEICGLPTGDYEKPAVIDLIHRIARGWGEFGRMPW